MRRSTDALLLTADGLPESDSIRSIIIKDAKSNASVYIPATLFNFFWRFINLLDPQTDSTKFAVGLTQTTVIIAIPLSAGSTVIHALIKALQHDNVQALIQAGNNRDAATEVLAQLLQSVKNPDNYFKALYDFATCVGWSAGYIAFSQIAEERSYPFWAKLCLDATGAAIGNVTGAIAIGIIWSAGTLAYDFYAHRHGLDIDSRPPLSTRTFNYLKESVLTIPPSMLWSLIGDANLFDHMKQLPDIAFRYATDSFILSTAVTSLSWIQNLLTSRFCPTPISAAIMAENHSELLLSERTPLLLRNPEEGLSYSARLAAQPANEEEIAREQSPDHSPLSSRISEQGMFANRQAQSSVEEHHAKKHDNDKNIKPDEDETGLGLK